MEDGASGGLEAWRPPLTAIGKTVRPLCHATTIGQPGCRYFLPPPSAE
ncbi:MAG: hypothetical protein MSA28_05265 [Prevotella sp.]|nr:hypothetical protein [Prevotella sp.]